MAFEFDLKLLLRPDPVRVRPSKDVYSIRSQCKVHGLSPTLTPWQTPGINRGESLKEGQSRSCSDGLRTHFDSHLEQGSARLAPATQRAFVASNKACTVQGTIDLHKPLPELPARHNVNTSRPTAANFPYKSSAQGVRRPTRSVRSSLSRMTHRISLTPSDIQLPKTRLGPEDQNATQELLGLQRRSDIASSHAGSGLPPSSYISQHAEPQSGRTAWVMASAAVLIVFNCWGFSNAFGLFQAYYEHYYLPGTSPGTIAWIGSTQIALVFGLGVPVGHAVDRGYFRLAFHGGTVVMLLGLLLSSFCKSWVALWLVQGLITGLGMGSVFTAGLIALMSWFDERKMGLAMGLGAAGSCLGGIAFILIARTYLPTSGFATTMRIFFLVSFLTMIPPNLVFRMRRQPRRSHRYAKRNRTWTSWVGMVRHFADAPYLFAAAGLFFAFQGLYFGFIYLISYAVDILHLDSTEATNLLIFTLLANLPGRFVPAFISDKYIGPLNTLIPSTLMSSAILWLWIGGGDLQLGSLTVIACFYGFVSAGIQSLYAPATYSFCLQDRDAAQHMEPEAVNRTGLRAGVIFSTIGVATLVGTPIAGALVSVRKGMEHPYLYAQIFAALSLLVGACLLFTSRMLQAGCNAKRA